MGDYSVGRLQDTKATSLDDEVTDYEYHLAAFGADREEGPHRYYEVPEGGWNRWFLTAYFSEELDRPESINASEVWFSVQPRSSDFGGGVYFDEYNPQPYNGDDIFGPSLDIGFGAGVVGFSVASIPLSPTSGDHRTSYDMDHDSYWEYDVSSIPRTPQECAGVRFNVNANQGMTGTHQIYVESGFGYSYKPPLSTRVYTEIRNTPSFFRSFTVTD